MFLAEAEGKHKLAEAYRDLNEAGLAVLLVQQFPEMVKAVAEGMNKVGNITVIQTGGDGRAVTSPVTQGVFDIVSSIPPILGAFGIDIKELIERGNLGGLVGETLEQGTTETGEADSQDKENGKSS